MPSSQAHDNQLQHAKHTRNPLAFRHPGCLSRERTRDKHKKLKTPDQPDDYGVSPLVAGTFTRQADKG
jgi:hypothetical protein